MCALISTFSRKVRSARAITVTIAAGRELTPDGVPVLEVAVDEHGERDEPADRRRRAERPPLEPAGRCRRVGELQAANASRSSAAGQRASRIVPDVIRPDRRLVEVDGIGERRERQRAADQRPRGSGPPARDPEDGDDEREQDDVGERVGEVDRLRREVPLVRGEDDLEQHGRADGGDREERGDPVEPDARVETRDPVPDEQDERQVRRRVEGEIERVGDRREGRVAGVRDAPEDVPERPARHSDSEQRPDVALLASPARRGRRSRPARAPRARRRPTCSRTSSSPAPPAPSGDVRDEEHHPRDRRAAARGRAHQQARR